MSKRRTSTRARMVIALLVAAPLLAAASAWAKEKSRAAQEGSPGVRRGQWAQTFHYSVHTLSAGQTARLTVVNPVLASPPEPVAEGGIVPCIRVTLAFDIYAVGTVTTVSPYDGANNPPDPVRLSFVRRVERVVELEPGDGATFEYTPGAGETVNPVTFVSEGEANPPDPVRASVVTSLEVRQDGATQFVLPGTLRGFNPQPDPPRTR
jgi:hypothetical protein